jgi:hypothetical protein
VRAAPPLSEDRQLRAARRRVVAFRHREAKRPLVVSHHPEGRQSRAALLNLAAQQPRADRPLRAALLNPAAQRPRADRPLRAALLNPAAQQPRVGHPGAAAHQPRVDRLSRAARPQSVGAPRPEAPRAGEVAHLARQEAEAGPEGAERRAEARRVEAPGVRPEAVPEGLLPQRPESRLAIRRPRRLTTPSARR